MAIPLLIRVRRNAHASPTGGAEGKPERWQIKTIDTGRFANFRLVWACCRDAFSCADGFSSRWRKVIFTAIPALKSDKELFGLALKVLETTAVPLMVGFPRLARALTSLTTKPFIARLC